MPRLGKCEIKVVHFFVWEKSSQLTFCFKQENWKRVQNKQLLTHTFSKDHTQKNSNFNQSRPHACYTMM